MKDKRAFPRHRIEVVVEFAVPEAVPEGKAAGMTYDVSLGGLFVRTTRIPAEGQKLYLTLRLAGGRQLMLQGLVVRTSQAPALLRGMVPTGFAMTVSNSESYRRFVESIAVKDSVASA